MFQRFARRGALGNLVTRLQRAYEVTKEGCAVVVKRRRRAFKLPVAKTVARTTGKGKNALDNLHNFVGSLAAGSGDVLYTRRLHPYTPGNCARSRPDKRHSRP